MRAPAKPRLMKQQCRLSNARQTNGIFVGPCPFPIVGHTMKLPRRMHSGPSPGQPLIIPLTLATSLSRANGLVMISIPCSIPSLPATTLSA